MQQLGDARRHLSPPLPLRSHAGAPCWACRLTFICCVTFLNVSPKVEKSTVVKSTAIADLYCWKIAYHDRMELF